MRLLCDVRNLASARTALAAGFRFEGVARDGVAGEDRPRPAQAIGGDTEDDDEEHREDAEQAVAGEQQTPMKAHADGVAHDPAPPAPPFLAQRLALLRINDRAIDLPDLVARRDQRPGEVEILDIGAIGEADLTQCVSPKHAARARNDERRSAENLLERALDDDHRQLDAGSDIAKQPAAAQIGPLLQVPS